jgi:hypothetical protein
MRTGLTSLTSWVGVKERLAILPYDPSDRACFQNLVGNLLKKPADPAHNIPLIDHNPILIHTNYLLFGRFMV